MAGLSPGPLTDKILISFVGFQGSGKSTIGKKVARLVKTDALEISDVVKSIHEGMTRSELPGSSKLHPKDRNWLGKAVGHEIHRISGEQGSNVVILSGVREIQIHKYLARRGADIWALEVRADAPVRYRRLRKLGKVATVRDFLDHEAREVEMGLREVMESAPLVVPCSDESSADDLAQAVKLALKTKGVQL